MENWKKNLIEKKNIIVDKNIEFALKIIEYSELLEEKRKYVIVKQLLRSGTSIEANIHEAQSAESKADFIQKRKINNFHLSTFSNSHILSFNFKIMYIIAVYDIGEKRVGKMLKLMRRYLNWIQNSVFEGEISEVKLKSLTSEAESIMDKTTDSLIYFKSQNKRWLEKEVVGKELSNLDTFL